MRQTAKATEGTIRELITSDFGYIASHNDLSTLTQKELIEVAKSVGANVTGTKAELRHNIITKAEEYDAGVFFLPENKQFSVYAINSAMTDGELYIMTGETCDLLTETEYRKAVSEYIAKNRIYVQIARGTIYSIATKGSVTEGTEACQRIINNGYREEIVADLEMSVYEMLHNAILDGHVSVTKDRVSFPKGLAYKAILSELGIYRQRQSQTKVDSYADMPIDGIPFLSQVWSIDDFLANEDIISFMRFVAEKMGKKAPDAIRYIRLSMDGHSRSEIASDMGVSERTITRLHIALKTIKAEYGQLFGSDDADKRDFGVKSWYAGVHGEHKGTYIMGAIEYPYRPEYEQEQKELHARLMREKEKDEQYIKNASEYDGDIHVYYTTSGEELYFMDGKPLTFWK